MCHKAKILPGFTFRLNVSSCSPYNADQGLATVSCFIRWKITYEGKQCKFSLW